MISSKTLSSMISDNPSALIFKVEGNKHLPAFVCDLTGRLIFRCAEASPNSDIPYAHSVVPEKADPLNPWAITLEYLEKRLRQLASINDDFSNLVKSCYPDAEIPCFPGIYIPAPVEGELSELKMQQLISDFEASNDHSEVSSALRTLAGHGIHPIPPMPFNPLFHESLSGDVIEGGFEVVHPGWLSHKGVINKTLVRAK